MLKIALLKAARGEEAVKKADVRSHFDTNGSSTAAASTIPAYPSGAAAAAAAAATVSGLGPTSATASLQPRNWNDQANLVTSSLADVSQYKSLAVYCQVKLKHALDASAAACPEQHDQDGNPLPNQLRTAVCCQLLGEFAALCGPFAETLTILRDELVSSIYSSWAEARTSGPLGFDQLPWFAVSARLTAENQLLKEQQAELRQELLDHQDIMAEVEQQLQQLKSALDTGERSAVQLKDQNATLAASAAAARADASNANDEVSRLTKQLARVKEELLEMKEVYSALKDSQATEAEAWTLQLDSYRKQLHVAEEEKEVACQLAATRVPQEELDAVQQQLDETQDALEEAQRQLDELAPLAAQQELLKEHDIGSLTPRPDWEGMKGHEWCRDAPPSSVQRLQQLQTEHQQATAALQQALDVRTAWAAPDAAASPWSLNLMVDSSSYFITEQGSQLNSSSTAAAAAATGAAAGGGGGETLNRQRSKLADRAISRANSMAVPTNPSAEKALQQQQQQQQQKALPAGLSLDVPRLLRWTGGAPVPLVPLSLQQLQQLVRLLWQAKAAYDVAVGPQPLHTFTANFLAAGAPHPGDNSCSQLAQTPPDAAAAAASNPAVASSSSRDSRRAWLDCWKVLYPIAASSSGAELQGGAAAQPAAAAAAAAKAGAASPRSGAQTPRSGPGTPRSGSAASRPISAATRPSSAAVRPGSAMSRASLAAKAASAAKGAATKPPVQKGLTAEAVAAACYSFYHALRSCYGSGSLLVDLTFQVLTGQLPEAVLQEQQHLLVSAVAAVQHLQQQQQQQQRRQSMRASKTGDAELGVSPAAPGHQGRTAVSLHTWEAALKVLLPGRSQEQLSDLVECSRACAAADAAAANSGDNVSGTADGGGGGQVVDLVKLQAAMEQQLLQPVSRLVAAIKTVGSGSSGSTDKAAESMPADDDSSSTTTTSWMPFAELLQKQHLTAAAEQVAAAASQLQGADATAPGDGSSSSSAAVAWQTLTALLKHEQNGSGSSIGSSSGTADQSLLSAAASARATSGLLANPKGRYSRGSSSGGAAPAVGPGVAAAAAAAAQHELWQQILPCSPVVLWQMAAWILLLEFQAEAQQQKAQDTAGAETPTTLPQQQLEQQRAAGVSASVTGLPQSTAVTLHRAMARMLCSLSAHSTSGTAAAAGVGPGAGTTAGACARAVDVQGLVDWWSSTQAAAVARRRSSTTGNS